MFSKSSERQTRTRTLTYLERDTGFGTPKDDLSGGVDTHATARMFSVLSCTAHWHAFLCHLRSSLIKFSCYFSFFLQEGDRTQLFDCAIEKLLVRFPHRATAPTHLHLAHLRFAHKGHYTLLSWSKDVQLRGATHCTSC